jgi:hypothetical protein
MGGTSGYAAHFHTPSVSLSLLGRIFGFRAGGKAAVPSEVLLQPVIIILEIHALLAEQILNKLLFITPLRYPLHALVQFASEIIFLLPVQVVSNFLRIAQLRVDARRDDAVGLIQIPDNTVDEMKLIPFTGQSSLFSVICSSFSSLRLRSLEMSTLLRQLISVLQLSTMASK